MNQPDAPRCARQPYVVSFVRRMVPCSIAALALGLAGPPAVWAQQATGGAAGTLPEGVPGGAGGDAGMDGANGSASGTGIAGVGGAAGSAQAPNGVDGSRGSRGDTSGAAGGGGGGGGYSHFANSDITAPLTGGAGGNGATSIGMAAGGGGGGGGGDGVRINGINPVSVMASVIGGNGGGVGDGSAWCASSRCGGGGGGGAGVVRLSQGGLSVVADVAGGKGGFDYSGGGGGGGGAGVVLEQGGGLTIDVGAAVVGGEGGYGGGGAPGDGGSGVRLNAAGTVRIADGTVEGGLGRDTGAGGAAVSVAAGSRIDNAGVLQGGAGGGSQVVGAPFTAGGTGSGGAPGFVPDTPREGRGGAGVLGAAEGGITVVNAGAIRGGTGYGGQANAVSLFGSGNRVELHAGASFAGSVEAAGGTDNVLALGGVADAWFDVSQIGTTYRGFTAFEKTGPAYWIVTGASAFHGPTVVRKGALSAVGSITGSAVTVELGAALVSSGGAVGETRIRSGGRLIGAQDQTLTLAALDLSAGASLNVVLDVPGNTVPLFAVAENLALGGTLHLVDGGGFGSGTYRLIDYSGDLSGTLGIGSVPPGFLPQQMRIDSCTPGQINLLVAPAGQEHAMARAPETCSSDEIFANGFDGG